MTRYRYLDFAIDSDRPFPELEPWPEGPLRIALRQPNDVPEPEDWFRSVEGEAGEAWLRIGRVGTGYVFEFPNRLRMLYGRGHLDWHADPSLPPETWRHLVLDQVLPLVAAHEGYLVVHAACAMHSAAAVLVAGPAGEGKSTLVASLIANGWAWAADDAVALRVEGETLVARPAYGGVRLWPDATLALRFAHGLPVSARSDKRRFARAPLPARDVAVSALYVLSAADPEESLILAPLSRRESMMALVRNSYVLDERDRERAAAQFEALAAVASRVEVHHVTLPHRFEVLDELRTIIERGLVAHA